MEILTVKMALITNLVLLILFGSTSTTESTITTMSMTTLETTTLESTESPSTMDVTSSYITETETPAMTSIITVTSSMSPSTPETTPQSTPVTTMPSSTAIMTSTVLSSPPKTTLMSTMSPMETTMTPNGTSPTMATAGPVLGQVEIIAIGIGGGVLILVLTTIAAFCIYKKCRGDSTDTRPLSQLDEDDCTARMSMHRPESATLNLDGDRAFMTFIGNYNEVDGIVNPTYDTTVIDEIPNNNQDGEEKVNATVEGSATIPSKARLTQNSDERKNDGDADVKRDVEGAVDASETGNGDNRDVEGAVDASETGKEDVARESPAAIKAGEVRPISGVSYKSEDIDLALEVLDVGTV